MGLKHCLLLPLAILFFAGCKQESGTLNPLPIPETRPLTVGSPQRDTLARTDRRYYSSIVTPETSYVVSITGLTDSALSLHIYGDRTFVNTVASITGIMTPKDWSLPALDSTLFIMVDAGAIVADTATYTIMVVEKLVIPNPVDEGSMGAPVSIPEGIPVTGQVASRGRSYYAASGLVSGRMYTVSITGLSGDADLHLFPDGTYSMEFDCTLRRPIDAIAQPEECTLTTQGSLFFTVTGGEVNPDGAAYTILVN